MVFSNFFNFFAIFLEFSIPSRVGTHRNYFFFFFSLSWLFATYFGQKRSYDGIFKFFECFCYFFRIFYYGSGKHTLKRFFLFSLFLGLFQPILVGKEAIMVFSNLLNFFAIFLEFSITSRVGIHKNDFFFFFFHSFSAFPDLFWLEKKL